MARSYSVVLGVALALTGCVGGNGDASPSVNAQSVPGNPPSGGSAAPPGVSAFLYWTPVTEDTDGNLLKGLAGYEIHYGTSPGALPFMIIVNDPDQTTYTVPGLPPGTWYFAVNAYTTSGAEGVVSNIASKTIN
jgi:hypothetical protein